LIGSKVDRGSCSLVHDTGGRQIRLCLELNNSLPRPVPEQTHGRLSRVEPVPQLPQLVVEAGDVLTLRI